MTNLITNFELWLQRRKAEITLFTNGYRCSTKKVIGAFSLSGVKKKWNGVVVTVKNSDGQTLSESGETTEEASKKVIDKIDTLFD